MYVSFPMYTIHTIPGVYIIINIVIYFIDVYVTAVP